MVVFRDFFAVQGHLHVRKLIQNACRGLLRLLTHLITVLLDHVELEARIVQSIALDLQRLGEQVLVLAFHIFCV